jgi:hypothetical protein
MEGKKLTADFVQVTGQNSNSFHLDVSGGLDLVSLHAAVLQIREQINTNLTNVIKDISAAESETVAESIPNDDDDFEEEEADYLTEFTKTT